MNNKIQPSTNEMRTGNTEAHGGAYVTDYNIRFKFLL